MKYSELRSAQVADATSARVALDAAVAADSAAKAATDKSSASSAAFAEAIVAGGGQLFDPAAKVVYIPTADGKGVATHPVATVDDDVPAAPAPAPSPAPSPAPNA